MYSVNHLLTHSPSLFDALGSKASASEYTDRHTLLSVVQCAAYDLPVVVAVHWSVLLWPMEHPAELAAVQHSSAGTSMQLKNQIITDESTFDETFKGVKNIP